MKKNKKITNLDVLFTVHMHITASGMPRVPELSWLNQEGEVAKFHYLMTYIWTANKIKENQPESYRGYNGATPFAEEHIPIPCQDSFMCRTAMALHTHDVPCTHTSTGQSTANEAATTGAAQRLEHTQVEDRRVAAALRVLTVHVELVSVWHGKVSQCTVDNLQCW